MKRKTVPCACGDHIYSNSIRLIIELFSFESALRLLLIEAKQAIA